MFAPIGVFTPLFNIMPVPISEYPGKQFVVCNDVETADILYLSGVVAIVPADMDGNSRLPCDNEAFQGQKDDQVLTGDLL